MGRRGSARKSGIVEIFQEKLLSLARRHSVAPFSLCLMLMSDVIPCTKHLKTGLYGSTQTYCRQETAISHFTEDLCLNAEVPKFILKLTTGK